MAPCDCPNRQDGRSVPIVPKIAHWCDQVSYLTYRLVFEADELNRDGDNIIIRVSPAKDKLDIKDNHPTEP